MIRDTTEELPKLFSEILSLHSEMQKLILSVFNLDTLTGLIPESLRPDISKFIGKLHCTLESIGNINDKIEDPSSKIGQKVKLAYRQLGLGGQMIITLDQILRDRIWSELNRN